MKNTLLDKISIFLLRRGFTLKNLTRTCFDIFARRNEQILLIKVLNDVNSISKQYSEDMISVASYINASPLIIAEKAAQKLEDNVVYLRFDIYTLNFNTFVNSVNNKFPLAKRSHAGLTFSLKGKKLREKREGLGYSLNALSKKIGVTGRMITKYENEDSEVTLNRAVKLYNLFGSEVFNELSIFENRFHPKNKFKGEISKKYVELGFDVAETTKTPFDIIAKMNTDIILTEVSDKINPQMQPLSKLLEADNLVIFHKKKPKNIPSMTKKEFMDFNGANELLKFLKEF